MDFLKIIDFASKYLADYFAVLFSTLKDPTPAYPPVEGENTFKLNSNLMGFALISITIGATINAVIPNRPPNVEVFTTSIVTLIMWIIYSLVIFSALALSGRRKPILDVVTICLQLFGAVYVVSNLSAFLWGMAAVNPIVNTLAGTRATFKLVVDNPFLVFYFIQTILLVFYLPKLLTKLNGLDALRRVFITFTSALFIFFCGIGPFLSVLINPAPTTLDEVNAIATLIAENSVIVMNPYQSPIPTLTETSTPTLEPTYTPSLTSSPFPSNTPVFPAVIDTPFAVSTLAP